MQAAEDAHNNLKKYFTAHVLTYHRDQITGEYKLLLGKKSVVSYYMVHQYLYHRLVFKKRVQNNIENPHYSDNLKLTKIFNQTSSGQYVTPGGKPKQFNNNDLTSSYQTISNHLSELPEDTAAREWLEEVYCLFFDTKVHYQLQNIVKRHLFKLYEWPCEYGGPKFGIIYGLNLDTLKLQLPEVARIISDNEVNAVNQKLERLDVNLQQLMKACLSVDFFKDVYSQPSLSIDVLSEFESIKWVRFNELAHYIDQKGMRNDQHFLNWLAILYPVYQQLNRDILQNMKVKTHNQLRPVIARCLEYNVNFIKQALQILVSHIMQKPFSNHVFFPHVQQSTQSDTDTVITQQSISTSLIFSEDFKHTHNHQNMPATSEQRESMVITIDSNSDHEIDQDGSQHLLQPPLSNEHDKDIKREQNSPATENPVQESMTTSISKIVGELDPIDSQPDKEKNHQSSQSAEQFNFRCNLL